MIFERTLMLLHVLGGFSVVPFVNKYCLKKFRTYPEAI